MRSSNLFATVGLLLVLLPGVAEAKTRSKPARRVQDRWAQRLPETETKSKASMARNRKARSRHRAETRGAPPPERVACRGSYNKATERIRAGQLREGRLLLKSCVLPICGTFLEKACTTLHAKLEGDIPSVVPVVTDASAAIASQIEVKMDGEVLASKIDGQAIAVDPGHHQFTFSDANGVFATEEVLIVQGHQNRSISVSLHKTKTSDAPVVAASAPKVEGSHRQKAAAPVDADDEASPDTDTPAADSEEARPKVSTAGRAARQGRAEGGASWTAYALGGIGVVGIGGYAALTWKGRQDNNTLIQSCKPDCSLASVHHIRMVYLAADISMGVGIAALVASTLLFATSPSAETASTRLAHISAIDVQTTPSGALATVGGAF
jgi:hypothetical protein